MTALTDLLPTEAIGAQGYGERWTGTGDEPEAVVHPESTEDVSRILSWASEEGVGVVPVGTGTHLDRRAMHGRFIVLSTDRLTGIEIYEPADLTLTAKAGTALSELVPEMARHRQWLPFDPPHVGDRSLGGLVAAGLSGPLRAGYGELRNHVLGATAVCGDGLVLRLGGRVVKNVAGFDLLRPMVGSRGRLAVLTSVCVRLFPVPEVDRLLVLRADSMADLVEAARAAATAPVLPASSVLVSAMAEFGGGPALLLRLHGAETTVDAEQAKLERHMRVSFEAVEGDGLQGLATAVRDHASAAPVVLHITALPSRLAEVVAHLASVSPAEVVADAYGGGVRVGLESADAELLLELRRNIESLGGTLAAPRLSADVDPAVARSQPFPEELELAAQLEKVFDPQGVLWRHGPDE